MYYFVYMFLGGFLWGELFGNNSILGFAWGWFGLFGFGWSCLLVLFDGFV